MFWLICGVQWLPNSLTLMNLLCGSAAIMLASQGYLVHAAILVMVGAFFDLIDGAVARALKVQSEVGKQLDSLADLVSFGVAPAFLLYQLLRIAELPGFLPDGTSHLFIGEEQGYVFVDNDKYAGLGGSLRLHHGLLEIAGIELELIHLLVILLPAGAALRLARFNVAGNQPSFSGLPTPAVGLFIASWVLGAEWAFNTEEAYEQVDWLLDSTLILSVMAALSLLMLLPLRMISMKFASAKWKQNKDRYSFIITAVLLGPLVLLINNPMLALALIVVLYIIVSVIFNLIRTDEV